LGIDWPGVLALKRGAGAKADGIKWRCEGAAEWTGMGSGFL